MYDTQITLQQLHWRVSYKLQLGSVATLTVTDTFLVAMCVSPQHILKVNPYHKKIVQFSS